MNVCSIDNCRERHYAKGLCKKHYQKQYRKQYQKHRKQNALINLVNEVNEYDWIKDKKAMILDGKLADKRMNELKEEASK